MAVVLDLDSIEVTAIKTAVVDSKVVMAADTVETEAETVATAAIAVATVATVVVQATVATVVVQATATAKAVDSKAVLTAVDPVTATTVVVTNPVEISHLLPAMVEVKDPLVVTKVPMPVDLVEMEIATTPAGAVQVAVPRKPINSKTGKIKKAVSRRYNLLSLLPSGPGEVNRELAVPPVQR